MAEYFDSSGPSTNYAQFETSRPIYLSSSLFARTLCQAFLGLDNEMVEAIVGRYIRGKRKGMLRGHVIFTKCVHGGWVTRKGVVGRGITEVSLCVSGFSPKYREMTSEPVLTWERK